MTVRVRLRACCGLDTAQVLAPCPSLPGPFLKVGPDAEELGTGSRLGCFVSRRVALAKSPVLGPHVMMQKSLWPHTEDASSVIL